MADVDCYVCPRPPAAEVVPTAGGRTWLVPLCPDHLGTGVALLLRMFPDDPEHETSCEVVRVGEWPLVEDGDEDG